MREIKFRAWDKACKHMINDFNPICHGEMNIFDFSFLARWREGIIPMQYTGLKDKNGKEIYEEDVVIFLIPEDEQSKLKCQVMWNDCGFYLLRPDNNRVMFISNYADVLKVIGNIYENPELLGRGDDVEK